MPTIRLRFPSNRTLANICVYGAMASISAVMYMRWKLQDQIRNTEYFRLAFQTLRRHRGAISLLGEPIKENGFDLSNLNNVCDGNKAQFEVRVWGPRDKGKIFFWAFNDNNGWLIERLELEIQSFPNKRFILKKPIEWTNDAKTKNHINRTQEDSHIQGEQSKNSQIATTTLNQTEEAKDYYIQVHDELHSPSEA